MEDKNAQIIVNEDGAFIPRALFGRINAALARRWPHTAGTAPSNLTGGAEPDRVRVVQVTVLLYP